jgi:hypothetical protein
MRTCICFSLLLAKNCEAAGSEPAPHLWSEAITL